MKVLANENIPGSIIRVLKENGHDVIWIRESAPGSSDPDVLALAQAEERILITFDKDFGELAFRTKLPAACGIVLFRISLTSPEDVAYAALTAIESRTDWNGHFSVVEDKRIRMTALPNT